MKSRAEPSLCANYGKFALYVLKNSNDSIKVSSSDLPSHYLLGGASFDAACLFSIIQANRYVL